MKISFETIFNMIKNCRNLSTFKESNITCRRKLNVIEEVIKVEISFTKVKN